MLNELKNELNVQHTENGAKMYATTKSDLLDLFAQIGAMRNRSEENIIKAFDKAIAEDELLGTKIMFYNRDCRGGQGERTTFRVCLNHLAKVRPEIVRKNLHLISEYGRWDDLFVLFDTPVEKDMTRLIENQLLNELQDESVQLTLLSKWMPSINTSSKETRKLAKRFAKAYSISEKKYRQILSQLRKKIKVLEIDMSARNWDGIIYESVPSQAGLKYRNAFLRNDFERYSQYLEDVKKGEKKVNAGVLFPYEIIREIMGNYYYSEQEVTLYEEMWKSLPDYIEDSEDNSICVVDTSGSMDGLPIQVALSLGMYCAERLKGVFHNHFITFSHRPALQEIKGTNICEKIKNMNNADWDMSTNLKAVFELILETALKNNLQQEQLPNRLFIISDMQFDSACKLRNYDNYHFMDVIRKNFEISGYKMPQLVFWNVDAKNSAVPVSIDENGIQLVSGCSPSIFKSVLASKDISAYDLMLEVLNQKRYSMITI